MYKYLTYLKKFRYLEIFKNNCALCIYMFICTELIEEHGRPQG